MIPRETQPQNVPRGTQAQMVAAEIVPRETNCPPLKQFARVTGL
jgi:hypothetical protein